MASPTAERGWALPGVLLGLGMGGFVDGIVLHQILQWHHMLSAVWDEQTVEHLRANVLADGVFHGLTWLLVAAGVTMLWRRSRQRALGSRSVLGWVLVGWGAFNLVEGVIDHHVLQIHRVRPGAENPLLWDIGFLAVGAALVAVGWMLQRSGTSGRQGR